MVKFQVVSDLHIETHSDSYIPKALNYITPNADILILAGDIGRIHKYKQLELFLKDVCLYFKIVIYVPGNHEYYTVHDTEQKTMEELFQDLLSIKQGIPNLYILDRNSLIIDDVCVIGCTLWSQVETFVPNFIVKIKDMTTEKYTTMFYQDLEYIKYMIGYCKTALLKPFVITHHSPTHLVAPNKIRTKFRSLYYSNLDYLLQKEYVHTWVYGHLHVNYDFYTCGGTHIVSNQKGKPRDNVYGFSKSKVICV